MESWRLRACHTGPRLRAVTGKINDSFPRLWWMPLALSGNRSRHSGWGANKVGLPLPFSPECTFKAEIQTHGRFKTTELQFMPARKTKPFSSYCLSCTLSQRGRDPQADVFCWKRAIWDMTPAWSMKIRLACSQLC